MREKNWTATLKVRRRIVEGYPKTNGKKILKLFPFLEFICQEGRSHKLLDQLVDIMRPKYKDSFIHWLDKRHLEIIEIKAQCIK